MSNTQNPLSAIEEVFHNYGQRRAALDYAFFKLNLPEHDVALLVDFIVRRRIGIAQVRVSIHAPTGGGVSFAEIPLDRLVTGSMTTPGQGAHIGDNWLSTVGSRGMVGDTAWDLAFQPVGSVLYPQIKLIEPLHPFDLSYRAAACVRSHVTECARCALSWHPAPCRATLRSKRGTGHGQFLFRARLARALVLDLLQHLRSPRYRPGMRGLTYGLIWRTSASQDRVLFCVHRREQRDHHRPSQRIHPARRHTRGAHDHRSPTQRQSGIYAAVLCLHARLSRSG